MIDYQTISALNQSTLKQILISPKAYVEAKERQEAKIESSEQHFVFGSLVDMMLTESKEAFDKKYAVIPDDTGVSETIAKIVKGVYDEMYEKTPTNLEDYPKEILQHCNYELYQSRWKDETRFKKIVEQGSKYFDILKKCGTKTIITESEYAKAVNCVMALRSDVHTSEYCQKKSDDPNIEIINKHVIMFEHDGLEFKGELDRIIVNHQEKTITPIDFKTTSKSVLNFENSFWHFRYDFQAAVYTLGLTRDKSDRLKSYYEDGYSFKPMLYIVVETFLKNPPMVFEISKEVINTGLYGNVDKVPKIKENLEGFYQAIKRFKYATEYDAWDYPMEYDTKGKTTIQL
tara:strand:+ start:19584 stop:20618 length:1035 start_codon:yes stop_codon:yes gene_type:complete